MSEPRDLPPLELARDLATVRAQIEEITALAGEDEVCTSTRPRVSAWSAGQQLEHLGIVLTSVSLAIKTLLRGRGEPGGERSELARDILELGRIPRGVARAPDGMRPAAGPRPSEVRAAVSKAANRWEKLYGEAAAIGAAELRAPHPLLGPLTAADWVRFAAVHNAHHLRIVDELLEG